MEGERTLLVATSSSAESRSPCRHREDFTPSSGRSSAGCACSPSPLGSNC